MEKVKELYCIIETNGDIIGRFTNKNRAIDCMIDYYFNGYDEEISLKTMTTKEYLEYTRKLIDKCK